MECPDCTERLTWNSDIDTEDTEGCQYIETLYHCPACSVEVIVLRKVPDGSV